VSEDRRARHEDVCPGRDDRRCVVGGDTPVDLKSGHGSGVVEELAGLAQAMEGSGNEPLSPEAWIDRHHEDEVEIRNDVTENVHGGGWVDRHAGSDSELANLLHGAVQVRTRFHMNGQDLGPGFSEVLEIPLGCLDHEVDVEEPFGHPRHGSRDGGAQRDVRYEVAIHDIDVDPLGTRGIDRTHIFGQRTEVSR
jgi:hypothetical protein